MSTPTEAGQVVYVGSYTAPLPHVQGKAAGIGVYRMDPRSGGLTLLETLGGVENPSYLTLATRQPRLYAVHELTEGRVRGVAMGHDGTGLSLLNEQPTGGADPAHLSLDREERWLLVANYSGGSIAVFPVGEDGNPGAATAIVQHAAAAGEWVNRGGPHAHWIATDPTNRIVLVADLGLDAVLCYRLDAQEGTLTPHDPPHMTLQQGAGPRHLAFRPDGRYVYVLNEMDSTITACAYNAEAGRLEAVQTISTLPEGYAGEENTTAALRVGPGGRFVYASNRGHDSIAIFACEERTGRLTLVGHEPTRGRTPRDFNIDPTGTFLLAANQDSDTIVTFRIDATTGMLEATGQVSAVMTPVCVAFGARA